MRIIAYLRVSTDKQAERRCSLEAQVDTIRTMALGNIAFGFRVSRKGRAG